MHHGDISQEIAEGLLALRERIGAANIPPSKIDETLNVATWNVREFGKVKRSDAAIHYIAEILGQFDLISIVELRDNLDDLARALQILGPYWRAVYSDMIADPGGNRERLGFIYDKRAVGFCGFAASGTPPRKRKGEEYLPEQSFWRPPYGAAFRSGDYDFVIFSVHVRWGRSKKSRVQELGLLANWIDAKAREKFAVDKDMIVAGDFNIEDDVMYSTVVSRGLRMPSSLVGKDLGSNLARNKRYDQILLSSDYPQTFTSTGGVLDFYANDHKALFPNLSKTQFTYQLSDHLPLWMQINTDVDDFKLEQISQNWRKDGD
jgi:Endonuclease/Exonuclease/phosphatase family